MRVRCLSLLLLAAGLACGGGGGNAAPLPPLPVPDGTPGSDGSAPFSAKDGGRGPVDGGEPTGEAGARDAGPREAGSGGDGGTGTLRVVAANLSSGDNQSYDPGEGLRILSGLKPDVVLLQEFNYAQNSDADLRSMVDRIGPSFAYARETGAQIPNGVVSRYPIVSSGSWLDPRVSNRSFVYAEVDVPGDANLWAVSVHLLTSSAGDRDAEAQAIVSQLKAHLGDGALLVVGGDFNTTSRTEACITTLGELVDTSGPYPQDKNGNANTNGTRSKPHDWVLASPALSRAPTAIGQAAFADGLVFDSRVYTPLSDVAPAVVTDSAASNMQHMAVVRDFRLP